MDENFDKVQDDDPGDYYFVNEHKMPPVTIFKNNQLGISINVEDHEESLATAKEKPFVSTELHRFMVNKKDLAMGH